MQLKAPLVWASVSRRAGGTVFLLTLEAEPSPPACPEPGGPHASPPPPCTPTQGGSVSGYQPGSESSQFLEGEKKTVGYGGEHEATQTPGHPGEKSLETRHTRAPRCQKRRGARPPCVWAVPAPRLFPPQHSCSPTGRPVISTLRGQWSGQTASWGAGEQGQTGRRGPGRTDGGADWGSHGVPREDAGAHLTSRV